MSRADPRIYSLSPEQLRFYNDNGYLVIRNLIDTATLEKCRKRFHDVCNGTAEKGDIVIIKETKTNHQVASKKNIVNKLHDIHFDDVFASYTEHSNVLNVLRQLIGRELRVVSSMYINKEPGSVPHPPHQDLAYLAVRPAHRVAAVWTAVDVVTRDNGALYVQPGSHKAGLIYEHGQVENANKAYHSIMDDSVLEPDKQVALEMSPGDTVFFHSLLIHGSGANNTQGHKRNCVSAHYCAEPHYYIEVCGGPLATVAKDLNNAMKSRGWDITYESLPRCRGKSIPSLPKSRI